MVDQPMAGLPRCSATVMALPVSWAWQVGLALALQARVVGVGFAAARVDSDKPGARPRLAAWAAAGLKKPVGNPQDFPRAWELAQSWAKAAGVVHPARTGSPARGQVAGSWWPPAR